MRHRLLGILIDLHTKHPKGTLVIKAFASPYFDSLILVLLGVISVNHWD